MRNSEIEFLLVQTRSSGRWTFPKGNAEPGLTHAQAAALEAFEEAGVHGRMEEVSFTRYLRRKRGGAGSQKEVAVNAHLCEVRRLHAPQEADRNPTWFSAEKARQRLKLDRSLASGAELVRVVDRAVVRIRRLRSAATSRLAMGAVLEGQLAGPTLDGSKPLPKKDALQKVRFIDDARTRNRAAAL